MKVKKKPRPATSKPKSQSEITRTERDEIRKFTKLTAEERAANIARKIGECAEEMGKEPCDLTWFDFREYAGHAYGMNRIGLVRREITRFGGFNALRDAYFPRPATDQQIVKEQVLQQAAQSRQAGRDVAHAAFVVSEIERLAGTVFKGRVTPYNVMKKRAALQRALTLMLSDNHFGSDLDKAETGHLSYGVVQESRRIAQVVAQTVDYKPEYREHTELHVALLGDLLHGKLHDQQDGALLSRQIIRAVHVLVQAIAHLAAHFPSVHVHCAGGNHGRILTRHPGRATVGKHDSHETVIYWMLQAMLSRFPNVKFDIPLTPYVTWEIFGQKFFGTHGDTVLKAGNPGKEVKTGSLEAQINRINASLQNADEYSAFLMGHVHVPMHVQLANGAHVVTNGPTIPADNYCVSLGLLETVCAQVLFETVPGHPVGDVRFISLNSKVDKNSSLDRIIKPWEGLESVPLRAA